MKLKDYILLVIVIVLAGFAIRHMVKHKGSCCGNCKNCSACSSCQRKQNKSQK